MRNFHEIIGSKSTAQKALIWGLVLLVIYKIWKWFLRAALDLHPIADYMVYEGLSTIFRFVGAVASIILVLRYYKIKDALFNLKKWDPNIKFIIFFIIGKILLFFVFHNAVVKGSSSVMFEFVVNFIVGFWEEFSFRGLLLVGFVSFMGPKKALILSSLIFSLWHFDVSHYVIDFVSLFFWGIIFGALYITGSSLVILSIMHFIWDWIFFSFEWNLPPNPSFIAQTYDYFYGLFFAFIAFKKAFPFTFWHKFQ